MILLSLCQAAFLSGPSVIIEMPKALTILCVSCLSPNVDYDTDCLVTHPLLPGLLSNCCMLRTSMHALATAAQSRMANRLHSLYAIFALGCDVAVHEARCATRFGST